MADFIIHVMANVITVKCHSSNRLFCEKVIKFAGPFVPLFYWFITQIPMCSNAYIRDNYF